MTISTGNYESREGVNRIMFPVNVNGERVMIVEKITRANQSTLFVSEDGRQFEAQAGDALNLVEVFIDKIEGVVEEAIDDAKDVVEDAVEKIGDIAGDALDAVQDILPGGGGSDEDPEEPVPGLKPDADGEAA